MNDNYKLYMLLLGCKPDGRYTEQHDVFFTIGKRLSELTDEIKKAWPEAKGKVHVDAWREITRVEGYQLEILRRNENEEPGNSHKLFFINLGGYKQNEFEEFHYKMVAVAQEKGEAIKQSKKTAFYKHTGFKNAPSHIDDKYGIDVDDVYGIEEILPLSLKNMFSISITPANDEKEDEVHLGYYTLEKIRKMA